MGVVWEQGTGVGVRGSWLVSPGKDEEKVEPELWRASPCKVTLAGCSVLGRHQGSIPQHKQSRIEGKAV